MCLEFKITPFGNGVGDECPSGVAVVTLHERDQNFHRYFLVKAQFYGAADVEK